jgi:predicted glycosyltransferase
MTTVIIYFVHPADINFYKNAINILEKKSINVQLIARQRGPLPSILEREYKQPFVIIGKHYHTLLGKLFGTIWISMQLLSYLSKKDFDVTTSFAGSFIGFASRLLGKPSVLFYDDYEYKLNFYSCKFSSSRFVIMPHTIPGTGKKLIKHKGLKELAYLHPKYFKPNQDVLKQFGLKSQNYVFLREKEYVSINYRKQGLKLADITDYIRDLGFDAIALSYDERTKEELKDHGCIIIEKPTDMHSLLSFAAFTIAAGDTMARESCLVGTPAIYTGNREMYANGEFIKRGCMFHATTMGDVFNAMKYIIENDIKSNVKNKIDHAIKYEWDDTTEVIVKQLLNAVKFEGEQNE